MSDSYIAAAHAFEPVLTKVIYLRDRQGFHATSSRPKIMDVDTVDLTWVRETEAAAAILYKGRCLRRLSQYTDCGGLFGSLENAVQDASNALEAWEIGESSELEVIVAAWMRDTPTLGYSHEEYRQKQYKLLQRDALLFFAESAKLGERLSEFSFPYEDRKWVQEQKHGLTKVWSSHATGEKNKETLEGFKAAVLGDLENRTVYPDDDVDYRD